MLTKRPCCVCRRWFVPDRGVGRRQRACAAPACQVGRRARTQASWRRRNPDYFMAHRVQRRRLQADEAQGGVAPLVLPPPLSLLPWDHSASAQHPTDRPALSGVRHGPRRHARAGADRSTARAPGRRRHGGRVGATGGVRFDALPDAGAGRCALDDCGLAAAAAGGRCARPTSPATSRPASPRERMANVLDGIGHPAHRKTVERPDGQEIRPRRTGGDEPRRGWRRIGWTVTPGAIAVTLDGKPLRGNHEAVTSGRSPRHNVPADGEYVFNLRSMKSAPCGVLPMTTTCWA
jgi:hypothetical protein